MLMKMTMVGGVGDSSEATTALTAASATTTATMAIGDEDSASTAVAIATMSNAVHHSSLMIAPEIPRWRFIAKAKKTEGYSSHAAGTIVQGLSAEELAGRYYNSDWRRNVVPHDNVTECVLASTDDGMKEEEGKSHAREIGKLDLNEATKDHDDIMFEYRVGREKRNIKDASDHGSTNNNDEDDENSRHHHLLLHPVMSAEEDNDGRLDQVERLEHKTVEQYLQELEMEEERSINSKHSEECESNIASSPALLPQTIEESPNPNVSKQVQNQERQSKMMVWMTILCLLLLLLAIILGIILGGSGRGRRITTDDKIMIAGEGGTSDIAALASTLHPTVAPSYSPSLAAQQQPTLVPNLFSMPQKPDAMITVQPILQPTDYPTMSNAPSPFPTFKPTCETDYNDFNLCFAIDMSGSGTFKSSQPLKHHAFRL